MKIDRLAEILDAYGGDPLRWPVAERLAAQGLAARDPRAAALVAEAEALDALIDTAPAEAPGSALVARVLAQRPKRSYLASLWADIFPETPVWRPAAAMALAVALGVGVQSAAAERLGFADSESASVSGDDATEGDSLAPLGGGESYSEEDVL